MFTELTAKQLTEKRRQELEPRRALYSSSAIDLEKIEVKSEPQRPILCDGCEKRAGAIGLMIFFCAPCQIIIRVHPNLGRVTYTPAQFARHGAVSPPIQVGLTECVLSDVAENAVSFPYQQMFEMSVRCFPSAN